MKVRTKHLVYALPGCCLTFILILHAKGKSHQASSAASQTAQALPLKKSELLLQAQVAHSKAKASNAQSAFTSRAGHIQNKGARLQKKPVQEEPQLQARKPARKQETSLIFQNDASEAPSPSQVHPALLRGESDMVYVSFKDANGQRVLRHFHLPRDAQEQKEQKQDVEEGKKQAQNFLKQKQYQKALHESKTALLQAPEDAELLYLSGRAHMGLQDWDAAKELFQECLKQDDKHSYAYFYLGEIFYQQALYANATQHYRNALALRPKMSAARLHLAVGLVRLKQYSEAQEHLLSLLQSYSKPKWQEEKIIYYLAQTHYKRGNYKEALALLDTQRKIPAVHSLKGEILYHSGRFAAATYHLQESLKVKPDVYQDWVLLSRSLEAQKKIPEALFALQKARSVYPMEADLHFNMARLYLSMGMKKRALASLENSLSIAPAHIAAV